MDITGPAHALATPDPIGATTQKRVALLPLLTKSSVGSFAEDGSLAVLAAEHQGYFLSGPLSDIKAGSLRELPPGRYRVEMQCRAGNARHPALPVIGVEVVTMPAERQAWHDFTAD